MDLGISGKVALVTGASKGIGRAIAQTLAEEGARVALVARSAEALEAVRQSLPGGPSQHRAWAIDLMADGGVRELVRVIQADLGDPELIVHNLGGSLGVTQTLAPVEDWQKVWQFNVGVAHELNRTFLPAMAARQFGRVVHLSTLSTRTFNGAAAYVSAKCALDGYIKAVSREFSKSNVIVSAVAPGAIYSEGRFFAKMQKEDPAALKDYFKHHLPIQRLGTTEEIARLVAFLCSPHSAFMPGSIVGIDGGGM